jgi:hypothetical protein
MSISHPRCPAEHQANAQGQTTQNKAGICLPGLTPAIIPPAKRQKGGLPYCVDVPVPSSFSTLTTPLPFLSSHTGKSTAA